MRSRPSVWKTLWGVVTAALVAGVLIVGYRVLRAEVAAGVYRERLEALAAEYETLRGRYNEAVRKTAVTELVVADGKLSVRVRNASGLVREIPTPYNPSGEIYVDYVVIDGRLFIRRVFDAQTPPALAMVVDPNLADIDWDSPDAAHGKAIYRRLGEGRWVVTATGAGALGLAKVEGEVDLSPPVEVKDYDELPEEIERQLKGIGVGEVWGHVFGKD